MKFCDVISIDNLFSAWREFCKGKRKKADALKFELTLEDNLFQLHEKLVAGIWKPDPYIAFRINDPKPRIIHKASVRDRVLFQAVYRKLYPVFDSTFIFDSYSSRLGGGTHRAVKRLAFFARKLTGNYRNIGLALKCDIRKFFDSIDHSVLKSLIRRKIFDKQLLDLIDKIIDSFETESGKGLPLGNVTSQLFTNIYLNELDQFVKHKLKIKYYVRYCDDFIFLSRGRSRLAEILRCIVVFLRAELCLDLHDRKVIFRKIQAGTDFLGFVVLPHRLIVRTRTKNRMLKRVCTHSLSSYEGILLHTKGWKLGQQILKLTRK